MYFAVFEGNICGCGNSSEFLEASDKANGVCDSVCPGDGDEYCGGPTSYSLYKFETEGKFILRRVSSKSVALTCPPW